MARIDLYISLHKRTITLTMPTESTAQDYRRCLERGIYSAKHMHRDGKEVTIPLSSKVDGIEASKTYQMVFMFSSSSDARDFRNDHVLWEHVPDTKRQLWLPRDCKTKDIEDRLLEIVGHASNSKAMGTFAGLRRRLTDNLGR